MFIPSHQEIESLGPFSVARPLRVLASACLAGDPCGVDGSSYGEYPAVKKLLAHPFVKHIKFCPEDFWFGTPRNMPDIHGGNGFDVLDGKARVLTDKGEDWTEGFVSAAHEMLGLARENQIDIAVLMNVSAACGTLFIYDGCRMVEQEKKKYQKGPGVSAALLIRNGFRVMSQRDLKTMDHLMMKLDPSHVPDPANTDLHEIDWYKTYFKV